MSADTKLKSYIDRILRCREAEDAAKDDTKAVYAELAGEGYEKSVVGQVVTFLRKREKDGDKLSEQSAKFDLYLEAYERPSHAHTRVRADDDVNPRLIKRVVDGMQTEAGRAALIAAVDIMIEREEAEEFQAKASGDNGATEQDIEDTADSVTGDASRSSRGDDSPATHSEKNAVATQVEATAPISDERETDLCEAAEVDRAAANAGGDDVDRSGSPATHLVTGEGAANSALPTKPQSRLRPNCLEPTMCRSGTRDHCYSCRKAMEREDAA